MTRLAARLTRVEGDILRRRPQPTAFRLFWDDELVPCDNHPRCFLEPESGLHHAGVIRLTFATADLPRRMGS